MTSIWICEFELVNLNLWIWTCELEFVNLNLWTWTYEFELVNLNLWNSFEVWSTIIGILQCMCIIFHLDFFHEYKTKVWQFGINEWYWHFQTILNMKSEISWLYIINLNAFILPQRLTAVAQWYYKISSCLFENMKIMEGNRIWLSYFWLLSEPSVGDTENIPLSKIWLSIGLLHFKFCDSLLSNLITMAPFALANLTM